MVYYWQTLRPFGTLNPFDLSDVLVQHPAIKEQ
jgi:hypothetical protein